MTDRHEPVLREPEPLVRPGGGGTLDRYYRTSARPFRSLAVTGQVQDVECPKRVGRQRAVSDNLRGHNMSVRPLSTRSRADGGCADACARSEAYPGPRIRPRRHRRKRLARLRQRWEFRVRRDLGKSGASAAAAAVVGATGVPQGLSVSDSTFAEVPSKLATLAPMCWSAASVTTAVRSQIASRNSNHLGPSWPRRLLVLV